MADVVRIRVRGRSMLPSLADGDELDVTLGAPVTRGDVVLFMDGDVSILHRVLSIRGGRVLTQGDGAPRPDAPFDVGRILGVASAPRRPMFALRRLLAEHARISIRTILGRRVIAWLRVVRSFAIFLVLASSSAWVAVSASTAETPPVPPSSLDAVGLDLHIDNLTDLVRALPEGEIKATRMLELAHVYCEKAARIRESGRAAREERDKSAFEAYQNGAPHAQFPKLPADREADAIFAKAATIYLHVLKKYPAHARTEQTLERLVLVYLDLSEPSKAIALLTKLEALDPSSQALARSYVATAMGQHPVTALPLYEKAAAIAEPELKRMVEELAAECREKSRSFGATLQGDSFQCGRR